MPFQDRDVWRAAGAAFFGGTIMRPDRGVLFTDPGDNWDIGVTAAIALADDLYSGPGSALGSAAWTKLGWNLSRRLFPPAQSGSAARISRPADSQMPVYRPKPVPPGAHHLRYHA
jgi:hypothetical protein